MRKIIDIDDNIIDDLKMLAIKEKRRGKTDIKNFIEAIIEEVVMKSKIKK